MRTERDPATGTVHYYLCPIVHYSSLYDDENGNPLNGRPAVCLCEPLRVLVTVRDGDAVTIDHEDGETQRQFSRHGLMQVHLGEYSLVTEAVPGHRTALKSFTILDRPGDHDFEDDFDREVRAIRVTGKGGPIQRSKADAISFGLAAQLFGSHYANTIGLLTQANSADRYESGVLWGELAAAQNEWAAAHDVDAYEAIVLAALEASDKSAEAWGTASFRPSRRAALEICTAAVRAVIPDPVAAFAGVRAMTGLVFQDVLSAEDYDLLTLDWRRVIGPIRQFDAAPIPVLGDAAATTG